VSPADPVSATLEADWLALSRRACDGVRAALALYPRTADRAQTTGRGEGGDIALVIDRAAEDAIFAELEALGMPLTAVSEERGEVALGGGGRVRVVIDPIDGSLNAKRGFPAYAVSIAVASGPTMADVEFGYVLDLGREEEWWASRGGGAHLAGEPLPVLEETGRMEMLGLESAHPDLVADAAEMLRSTGASRLRAVGAIAITLCFVAVGRLDAMFSIRTCRSVDAAAAQLIVREAGGHVAFPDTADGSLDASLGIDMRSRVVAANGANMLEALTERVSARPPPGH